jgi:hypothetical protein
MLALALVLVEGSALRQSAKNALLLVVLIGLSVDCAVLWNRRCLVVYDTVYCVNAGLWGETELCCRSEMKEAKNV